MCMTFESSVRSHDSSACDLYALGIFKSYLGINSCCNFTEYWVYLYFISSFNSSKGDIAHLQCAIAQAPSMDSVEVFTLSPRRSYNITVIVTRSWVNLSLLVIMFIQNFCHWHIKKLSPLSSFLFYRCFFPPWSCWTSCYLSCSFPFQLIAPFWTLFSFQTSAFSWF